MKVLTNLDLSKNQLLNASLQKLSTPPASPVLAQLYYDTDDNLVYICTNVIGPVWTTMGSGYTHPNHSGDVTSAGDGATTIVADAVTNSKLANMATLTIKGNNTGSTGDPLDLTVAQVQSMLGLVLTQTALANGFSLAGGTASKTLTVSNTITLQATDGSTLNIGTGGTLGTAAYTASSAYATASHDFIGGHSATLGTATTAGYWLKALTTTTYGWAALSKTDVGLGNVENTALTTWTGNTSITSVGTIGTGTWNATAIADGKIASALTGKTYNALSLTAVADGFTIAGGTASRTLTISGASKTFDGTGTGITLTGAYGLTFTLGGATSLTLPASGTLATLTGTETLSGKTLTSPKFASADYIADVNGNELIKFPATVASAINEITIANAASGGSPSITATGGGTDLDLLLVSKGTGKVKANGTEVSVVGHTHSYEPTVASGTGNQIWGMNNAAGAKEWKSFGAIGTTGTAPAWALTVANTITLNIPMASAGSVTAGLLSNTDYAKIHTVNADTGTTSTTFQLNSGSSGLKLKDVSGALHLRNAADNAYADLRINNLIVDGTTTTINSNTVEIGDNQIVLNSDITTSATNSDGGIAIKRLMADNTTRKDAELSFNNTTGLWTVTDGAVTGTLVTSQIARKAAFDIGDATPVETSFVLTHNFNTLDVVVMLREVASGELQFADYVASGVNTVTINFGTAPTTGQYRAIVIG
jgi:hypothetical protein